VTIDHTHEVKEATATAERFRAWLESRVVKNPNQTLDFDTPIEAWLDEMFPQFQHFEYTNKITFHNSAAEYTVIEPIPDWIQRFNSRTSTTQTVAGMLAAWRPA
jgi:hypothetical protein